MLPQTGLDAIRLPLLDDLGIEPTQFELSGIVPVAVDMLTYSLMHYRIQIPSHQQTTVVGY